jgi:hypothetical protein
MNHPLADFALAHRAPDLHFPEALRNRKMHLDPDFENLTYGDNGSVRGAGIATLTTGDFLVFYAGLRSIESPCPLFYGLIGLFAIQEVVRATDVPLDHIHENAHTRWTPISAKDVIVRGRPGTSGRFDRCIQIGEWRNRAYRVRRDGRSQCQERIHPAQRGSTRVPECCEIQLLVSATKHNFNTKEQLICQNALSSLSFCVVHGPTRMRSVLILSGSLVASVSRVVIFTT